MNFNRAKMAKVILIMMMLMSLSSCGLVPPFIWNGIMGDDQCTPLVDAFSTVKCDEVTGVCPEKKYLSLPDSSGNKVGITTWIVDKIQGILGNISEEMFKVISGDSGFKYVLGLSLTLVIMFYGASIALGITQASTFGVFMVAVKMLLVFHLISDWGFFKELIVDNFEALVNDLSGYMSNIFSAEETSGETFAVVDQTISMFFNWNYMKVILALFFTGVTGWFYAMILVGVMLLYLWAIIEAVKVFIVALIVRTLLYAIAPIFLISALFSQTKTLFDGWLEQLLNFSLQPIFLFAFLGMFHLVLLGFFGAIVKNGAQVVCYDTIEKLAGFLPFLYGYRFGDGTPGKEITSGLMTYGADIPLNLWVAIAVAIIAYLMKEMADWSVQMATRLTSGFASASGVKAAGVAQISNAGTRVGGGVGGGVVGGVLGAKDSKGVKRGGIISGGIINIQRGGRLGLTVRRGRGGIREGIGAGFRQGLKRGDGRKKEPKE